MAYGPSAARSMRHDRGPNIFPSGPPTQSISTYYHRLKNKASLSSASRSPLVSLFILRLRDKIFALKHFVVISISREVSETLLAEEGHNFSLNDLNDQIKLKLTGEGIF